MGSRTDRLVVDGTGMLTGAPAGPVQRTKRYGSCRPHPTARPATLLTRYDACRTPFTRILPLTFRLFSCHPPAGTRCPRLLRRSFAAALLLVLPPAHAAPPPVAVPDTMAQRMQACTICHGKEGRATPEGYFPRIAGKPAQYLYQQLLNFRDGRRRNATMADLLEPLSEPYLREIAQHFATLDLPYAPPPLPQAPAAVLARGEALARQGDAARGLPACVQCHGEALTGVAPAIPGLLGLPRDYVTGQFGGWQTGQRRAVAPDCMARITQLLTPDDVSALAYWLASQPVPGKPAAALVQPLPMPCGSVEAK
jgi:cytochrome c553